MPSKETDAIGVEQESNYTTIYDPKPPKPEPEKPKYLFVVNYRVWEGDKLNLFTQTQNVVASTQLAAANAVKFEKTGEHREITEVTLDRTVHRIAWGSL